MQRPISNKIQLGDTLNPEKDYGGVPSTDDEGNLENLIGKVDKVGGFWKTGKADGDLARYLPNILPVTRQNQVAGQLPRKAYASVTYSDKNIRIYFKKYCKYLYKLQFYGNNFTNSVY